MTNIMNREFLLSVKQEKLISRLAMLSPSKKGSEAVKVYFFKSDYSLTMLSVSSTSLVAVSNKTIQTTNLLADYDRVCVLNSFEFRQSPYFNRLGLIDFKQRKDASLKPLFDTQLFKRINPDEIAIYGSDISQVSLDTVFLPKRLYSVFIGGKSSEINSKACALFNKVIGLNVLYISESR